MSQRFGILNELLAIATTDICKRLPGHHSQY
jgi:hypothetical protein